MASELTPGRRGQILIGLPTDHLSALVLECAVGWVLLVLALLLAFDLNKPLFQAAVFPGKCSTISLVPTRVDASSSTPFLFSGN